MRPYLASVLASLLLLGCGSTAPGDEMEEGPVDNDITDPRIVVDSPIRGTITEDSTIVVSGHVEDDGSGVASVRINGVEAELAPSGAFTAEIPLAEGLTFIDSTVSDRAGNESNDLRAVLSGQMAPQGTLVEDALVTHIGSDTLSLLGDAVTDFAEGADLGTLGQSFNPIVDAGGSCLGVELDLVSLEKSGVDMRLKPTAQGIDVEVVVHDVDADLQADYAVACLGSSAGINISANQYVLRGTLDVDLTSSGDIEVALNDLETVFVNFDLDVGAIPNVIVDMFNGQAKNAVRDMLATEIQKMVPAQANDFLAGFVGRSYDVNVLGESLSIDVEPSAIEMSNSGIRIRLDGKTDYSGATGASYLVSTRPAPSSSAIAAGAEGKALSVALSDDVANQALAGLWASGKMEALIEPLLIEQIRGFVGDNAETVEVIVSLPPVVTTNAETSAVNLGIGDLIIRASSSSETLVEFAISAQIGLTLENDGDAIVLVTDAADIRGKLIEKSSQVTINLTDDTVAAIAELAISQIAGQSDELLSALPLPSFGAIMTSAPVVKALDGYVLLGAELTN